MFLTLKRKNIVLSFGGLTLAIILLFAVGYSGVAPVFFGTNNARMIPVYSVDRENEEEKIIALTFDAAWGADKTLGIIDILNEYNAKGTFFLVGFWIDKYPDEVKAIANAGLDIGNHSENHTNMPRLNEESIKFEIQSVNDKIFNLTGKTPTYFRAPYGDYDNKLMTVLKTMNMTGVQWSIDTLDWKGLSAKEIVERVVPNAKNGDIVLFHNNSDHVLDALPLVLIGLKEKGFKFVGLSDLVATDNYTIDNNGIQHKNNQGENI